MEKHRFLTIIGIKQHIIELSYSDHSGMAYGGGEAPQFMIPLCWVAREHWFLTGLQVKFTNPDSLHLPLRY